MKLRLAIPQLLTALAVLGLILAPLARPATAMASDMQAAMVVHGSMDVDTAAAMPDGMPCCPDQQAPAKDCGKDCPLMALCAAAIVQLVPSASHLFMPRTRGTSFVPGNDIDLSGLAHGPPPRPPKSWA